MKQSRPTSSSGLAWLVAAGLAVLVYVAFQPVLQNEFVTFDDDVYITANPYVRAGLTLPGIAWAFRTGYYGIYHPLAWLSHMLDVQLFGLDPVGHHFHSLLIHIASTLLLFHVLRRATGSLWRSALVALLFGIHPLQVQSVAWAAERKNVLSAFFWMATLWAYVRFTEKPGHARYIVMIVLYTFGLLSKSFLMTLPIILLLLDVWPLGRASSRLQVSSSKFPVSSFPSPGSGLRFPVSGFRSQVSRLLPLVWEKLPLFLLALAASILSFFAARYSVNEDVLVPFEVLPLDMRLANVAVGYVAYAGKMIWPFRLTYLYAYPTAGWPLAETAAALCLLGLVTLLVVRRFRENPWLPVGWAWYLVVLLPNIGIVQYGWQAFADRYAYVPLIGLFILIAWGIPELTARRRLARPVFIAVALLLVPLLVLRTRSQTATWRDDEAFFRHGIECYPDTWTGDYGHLYLGKHLYKLGRYAEAKAHFIASLRGTPTAEAFNNLGAILQLEGNLRGAITWYTKALRWRPGLTRTLYNLGLLYQELGKFDEAAACYEDAIAAGPVSRAMEPDAALKAEPVDDDAHNNLGVICLSRGDLARAVEHFRAAIAFNPNHPNAHYNLGNALEAEDRPKDAAAEYEAALRLKADHEKARQHLEKLRAQISAPSLSQ
jgi:protein O-mannosyl-transferase